MDPLDDAIRAQLLRNGRVRRQHEAGQLLGLTGCSLDFLPVVKLFTPDAQAT
jgi:hypothetical protein